MITTDGSAFYPEPIATVFGPVPHQLCTFHVLKEITRSVRGAMAKRRKGLAAEATQLTRGRPGSKAARRPPAARSGLMASSASCSSIVTSSCIGG
jgi:hypothetical protein